MTKWVIGMIGESYLYALRESYVYLYGCVNDSYYSGIMVFFLAFPMVTLTH